MNNKKQSEKASSKSEISELLGVKHLFTLTNTSLAIFVLPIIFSLIATLFEAMTFALLVPLVKMMLEMNYAVISDIYGLGLIYEFAQNSKRPFLVSFAFIAILIFIASLFKSIFMYLSYVAFDKKIILFSHDLRTLLWKRYLSFGKLFFDRTNFGYLSHVILNFVAVLVDWIRDGQRHLAALSLLIAYGAILLFISWKLTLILALVLPVQHLFFNWILNRIQQSSKRTSEHEKKLSQRISNILTGILLVKTQSTEKDEESRFDSCSRDVALWKFSVTKKEAIIPSIQDVISVVTFLTLVSIMAYLAATSHHGDLAKYLVFILVLRRALTVTGYLSRVRTIIAKFRGPLSEIEAMLSDSDKHFIPDGDVEMKPFSSKIEFKNVCFSYRDGTDVIKDISFSIGKGQKIAIVGDTGSGKTTLINLLLRFYDYRSGKIEIDGIDIRKYRHKSLRNHIGLVSQDTVLFHDTLESNLVYGIEMPSKDELMRTIRQVRLEEFVAGLPEGLNTQIGDRGVQLSGGERQRVSIARAMLKGSEILIFDEATSQLDSKTETLIQQAIEEISVNKTVVAIAHRLATIKNADIIIVFERGEIVEQGSLKQLLEAKGKFYSLWNNQKLIQ